MQLSTPAKNKWPLMVLDEGEGGGGSECGRGEEVVEGSMLLN